MRPRPPDAADFAAVAAAGRRCCYHRSRGGGGGGRAIRNRRTAKADRANVRRARDGALQGRPGARGFRRHVAVQKLRRRRRRTGNPTGIDIKI